MLARPTDQSGTKLQPLQDLGITHVLIVTDERETCVLHFACVGQIGDCARNTASDALRSPRSRQDS